MKIITVAHIFFLIIVGPAFAQETIDPSTATLFKGARAPEPEDLDSSRFTITQPSVDAEPKAPPTVVVKKKKTAPPSTSTKIQVKPTPASVLAQTPSANNVAPASAPEERHSVADQVKVLILGNHEDIEDFHKQIHPADRRNNAVEISIAPVYIYDNSSSNYSFRSFTAQGPGFSADAKIWLTPFFGIHADYMSSLNATVMSPAAQQVVPLELQNIEFGVKFRKHFGLQRKSPSLTWGLDFIEANQSIPSSTVDRVSTATSGLSLNLQADIPFSLGYSGFIGVGFEPRLVHSETGDSNIHSGGKNVTSAIGAWLGGDWVLDRQHQMFWKIQERVEQNEFDGLASTVDPLTGSTPNGVSITNSMTIFSIGYRWGN